MLLAGALAVSAVGLVGLVVLVPGASEWRLLPGIVVLGVGYGAVNAALGREAIAHLPVAKAGMGSGTNNTARYVGSALGVTIAAVLAVPTAPRRPCAASTSRSSAVRCWRRWGRRWSPRWAGRRRLVAPRRSVMLRSAAAAVGLRTRLTGTPSAHRRSGVLVDHQPAAVVLRRR